MKKGGINMKTLLSGMVIATILLSACGSTTAAIDVTKASIPTSQALTVQPEIFGTMEMETSLAYEPTAQNLLNDATSVIKVKVTGLGDAQFVDGVGFSMEPQTPIEFELLDTVSGQTLASDAKIYASGGLVSLAEMVRALSAEQIAKMEIDTLTPQQQAEQFMLYRSDYDVELTSGQTYLFLVTQQVNGDYSLLLNGYSVFTPNDATTFGSDITATNVLSQEVYTFNHE